MDEFYKYPGENQYNRGLVLQEYKGEYSLIPARDSGGKICLDWAFPQGRDRNPAGKAIPVKVKLGDSKQEAIEMMRHFAQFLK